MGNNYDPIARHYDLLSRLFFGRTEINAQLELLAYVKPGSNLLIVGGGTGWILDELASRYPEGLCITYVEPSGKMMALSKKRRWGGNEVRFVQLPIEQFVTEERYDCILTGFVFDNFCHEKAARVIGQFHPLLAGGGYWLYADFHFPPREGKLWQWVLLRTMYFSARLICKVEANELPDTEALFAAEGFGVVASSFRYGGFIKSTVYCTNCASSSSSLILPSFTERK